MVLQRLLADAQPDCYVAQVRRGQHFKFVRQSYSEIMLSNLLRHLFKGSGAEIKIKIFSSAKSILFMK